MMDTATPNACHCKFCHVITTNTGTGLCDACWSFDRALDFVTPQVRNAILAERGILVLTNGWPKGAGPKREVDEE